MQNPTTVLDLSSVKAVFSCLLCVSAPLRSYLLFCDLKRFQISSVNAAWLRV
jgi:hypothetical protein